MCHVCVCVCGAPLRPGSCAVHHPDGWLQSEVVRQLVEAGAKVDVADSKGRTPLILAARKGFTESVRLLMRGHPQLNLRDSRGRTALGCAAFIVSTANLWVWCVCVCVWSGSVSLSLHAARRLRRGLTPSMWPPPPPRMAQGQSEVVRLLLREHAAFDMEDSERRTPLMLAALQGNNDSLRHLIQAGAELEHPGAVTALMMGAAEGHGNIVQQLLGAGASVDAVDPSGTTALMMAASEGHCSIMGMLLEAGAAVDAVDASGERALQKAAREGHNDCVVKLLEAGASPELPGSGAEVRGWAGLTGGGCAGGHAQGEPVVLLRAGNRSGHNSSSSSSSSSSRAVGVGWGRGQAGLVMRGARGCHHRHLGLPG